MNYNRFKLFPADVKKHDRVYHDGIYFRVERTDQLKDGDYVFFFGGAQGPIYIAPKDVKLDVARLDLS